jgi:hypothetical protein
LGQLRQTLVMPPSMTISPPTVNADSSEARKTTAPQPRSDGPYGLPGSGPGAVCAGLRSRRHAAASRWSRADRINADAATDEFSRGRAGDRSHAGFGRTARNRPSKSPFFWVKGDGRIMISHNQPRSAVGQKRHGLFVGYRGESATGRGPISAGGAFPCRVQVPRSMARKREARRALAGPARRRTVD